MTINYFNGAINDTLYDLSNNLRDNKDYFNGRKIDWTTIKAENSPNYVITDDKKSIKLIIKFQICLWDGSERNHLRRYTESRSSSPKVSNNLFFLHTPECSWLNKKKKLSKKRIAINISEWKNMFHVAKLTYTQFWNASEDDISMNPNVCWRCYFQKSLRAFKVFVMFKNSLFMNTRLYATLIKELGLFLNWCVL